MAQFNGTLNANEIYSALFNMIIGQYVNSNTVSHNYALADKFKRDGGLSGDTILIYETDALKTFDWNGDKEAAKLLELSRPADPKCQAVTIDVFRQIRLTIDNYLSKRAWSTIDAFQTFNNVMTGWMGTTKEIHTNTLINTFIGNTVDAVSNVGTYEIDVTSALNGATGEEANRLEAQAIATGIADLLDDMKDYSRDFNQYKFLRSFNPSDVMIVWNNKFKNKITKMDLPTIFHKDGVMDKFDEEVLPARYFGTVGNSVISKSQNDGTYRSTIEADYAANVGDTPIHVFAGDLIPAGTAKVTELKEKGGLGKYQQPGSDYGVAKTLSTGIAAGEYYTQATDVICKIVHKSAIPFLTAFTTNTSFTNSRSLTENQYITFGYSTPVLEYGKPFVTVKKV